VAEEWFRKSPYWILNKFPPLQENYLEYQETMLLVYIEEKQGNYTTTALAFQEALAKVCARIRKHIIQPTVKSRGNTRAFGELSTAYFLYRTEELHQKV
jgi:hypothetical protein